MADNGAIERRLLTPDVKREPEPVLSEVEGNRRTADADARSFQTSGCGAVVIGGDYRGLGVVRSLGRQGIPVWVLTDEHRIAATSRYAQRHLPFPVGDDAHQRDFLLDLAARHGLNGWMLFPTGDETAAFIARHHGALAEQFQLTVPAWDVIRWTYDKRLTYQLAADLGIARPWTHSPADRAELDTLDCAFPAILKPAIKAGANAFTDAKAWLVEDRATLLARYDQACEFVSPDVIMVQELIPGGGETQLSFAALCKAGTPLASIVARRTRQWPMDFGRSSSFVETVECPAIEAPARRLIAELGYTGLVEIEFKYDRRNGSYKLLDINPRVWGWHTLGRRAGVDFPYLLWRMIAGLPVAELRAQSGVHWVRMTTDVPTVAHEIRSGRLTPRDYLRSLRAPLEFAIFAADDPLPALIETPLLAALAWKRKREPHQEAPARQDASIPIRNSR